MTALELLRHKAHPILNELTGFVSDPLESEFEAAHAFGYIPDLTQQIDPALDWFELPRPTRAAIIVQMRLRDLRSSIMQYDQTHKKTGGKRGR